MKAKKNAVPQQLPSKIATGIQGFNELGHGGLILNRTSLLMGGPGSGKTVFAPQSLVSAVHERQEPGIFVALEEATRHDYRQRRLLQLESAGSRQEQKR